MGCVVLCGLLDRRATATTSIDIVRRNWDNDHGRPFVGRPEQEEVPMSRIAATTLIFLTMVPLARAEGWLWAWEVARFTSPQDSSFEAYVSNHRSVGLAVGPGKRTQGTRGRSASSVMLDLSVPYIHKHLLSVEPFVGIGGEIGQRVTEYQTEGLKVTTLLRGEYGVGFAISPLVFQSDGPTISNRKYSYPFVGCRFLGFYGIEQVDSSCDGWDGGLYCNGILPDLRTYRGNIVYFNVGYKVRSLVLRLDYRVAEIGHREFERQSSGSLFNYEDLDFEYRSYYVEPRIILSVAWNRGL